MFGVYDCTGHGVPGAFMTLLAERALDACVEASSHKRKNPNRAGEILSHVDDFIRITSIYFLHSDHSVDFRNY